MKKAKQFKVGDKVFAKVKGYPAWPAKVTAVNGKKYTVEFYGTGEIGSIKVEDIFYYLKHKSSLIKPSKRKDYNDALEQIEQAVHKDGTDGNDYPEDSLTDVSVTSSTPSEKTSALKRKRSLSDKGSDTAEPPSKVVRRKESVDSITEDPKEIKEQEGEGKEKEKKDEKIKGKSDEEKEKKTDEKKEKKADEKKGKDIDEGKEEKGDDVKEEKRDDVKEEKTDEEKDKKGGGKQQKKADEKKKDKEKDDEDTETDKEQEQENKVYNIEDLYGPGVVTGNEEIPPKFVETADTEPDPEEEEEEEKEMPEKKGRKPKQKKYDKTVKLVSERTLMSYIAYAKYVRENDGIYKAKPQEQRGDLMNHAFAVKLPSENVVALKLHTKWPLSFSNEYERAIYDEENATRLLKMKEDLQSGKMQPNEDPSLCIPNFKMSAKDVEVALHTQTLKNKKMKTDRLRLEATLVELDAKIKSCLGLDQADPEEALIHLTDMYNLNIKELMLIKHAHVVEMVRRLRKYIGNTVDWNLNDKALEEFQDNASKIRMKAEQIWEKFKRTVAVPQSATFWDGFNEVVQTFRVQTKHLNEDQIVIINAHPYTRRFFMDQYEEEHKGEEVTKAQPEVIEVVTEEPQNDTAGPSV